MRLLSFVFSSYIKFLKNFKIIFKSLNGKHELTIKNCNLNDPGVYTFSAQDARCHGTIKVNGKNWT